MPRVSGEEEGDQTTARLAQKGGTLAASKTYGLSARTQTLLDLSRTRLNGPTPHQVLWCCGGESPG